MKFFLGLVAPLRHLISSWRERRAKGALHRREAEQRAQGIWPAVCCAELPAVLEPQTIYLWGEQGHIWQVVMLCPCNCGETLHMTALTDDWPHWKVQFQEDAVVSLKPSVWRKIGCRSHFWVRTGRIQWC